MQNLLFKISPLLIFLFLFSCAKDSDLSPQTAVVEGVQARQGMQDSPETPCEVLCAEPDFLNFNAIGPCTAEVRWGFESDYCGTFIIQLQNLTTGVWTYFDPAVSPLVLTGLDPCTNYTLGVSHVTDICASVPLQASFTTDCRPCEGCNIDCQELDYAFVDGVTDHSAVFNFGFDLETCGHFAVQLKNHATGVWTYFDPATSPLELSGLSPCTNYTISVSHVTNLCARAPKKVSFTTDCPNYCETQGTDPSCLYNQYITFTHSGAGVWTRDSHTLGYADYTGEAINVAPGTVFTNTATGNCFCGNLSGAAYMKLWIDANENGIFENFELMYTHMYNLSGGGSSDTYCLDMVMPGFTVPNVEACGLRGRFIISTDPSAGPCGSFTFGQAIDFSINTTSPCY